MANRGSIAGELALKDANENFSLLVANAPGSSATSTVRLWANASGIATDPAPMDFGIPRYDYLALGYSGSNVTSVGYYSGGATGTLLATLTLGYSGANVTSVTRT